MFYGTYKKCRNSSWQCLADNKINSLPVPVISIAKNANIDVFRNRDVDILSPEESGVSIFDGQKWYIIFDEGDSPQRIRFTVMHELGHILLGHELKKGYHSMSSGKIKNKPSSEIEADAFAIRTLAPACVLWGLGIRRADDIAEVCNIPYSAAVVRSKRMDELVERNKFLTNNLEKEVFNNFRNYINRCKYQTIYE